MDLDRQRAIDNLKALGMKTADRVLGQYAQKGPFAALESGLIDADEFHRQMRALIDGEASDEAIDNAFIAFLTGIPLHRLQQLRMLRTSFKVYMLSNTNPIMWESEIKRQFRQEGFEINDYFDGIVTSFEAKAMKPDPTIFSYAASKLGISPDETLFLDDSADNCKAAVDLGWHAVKVDPGSEFLQLVQNYLEQ